MNANKTNKGHSSCCAPAGIIGGLLDLWLQKNAFVLDPGGGLQLLCARRVFRGESVSASCVPQTALRTERTWP